MTKRDALKLKPGDRVWLKHYYIHATITDTEDSTPTLKEHEGRHPLFLAKRDDRPTELETFTYLHFSTARDQHPPRVLD